MKLHVKKGDTVKVIAGNDKGKTGRVLVVYPAKSRAIVEGLNKIKKHTKPNPKNTQGGIIEKEACQALKNDGILRKYANFRKKLKKMNGNA